MSISQALPLSILLSLALLSAGCATASTTPEPTVPPTLAAASPTPEPDNPPTPPMETSHPTEETPMQAENKAHVRTVSASGEANAYRFSVEISSPDLGCEQYADWWEVVDEAGGLIYRRILAHSHVSEQPFTRSGGPIPIDADQVVWVRAHMHPHGYGGAALKGSVNAGFQPAELPGDFASALDQAPPLPEGCAF